MNQKHSDEYFWEQILDLQNDVVMVYDYQGEPHGCTYGLVYSNLLWLSCEESL